jgi:EPS-associated MarR family transcriptional regulator|tara:strand:+ start:473 stop:832 length:360 start_codon:yes stop_codon:yes gene_type:complete
MLTDELRYKIIRHLEADPYLSQRALAKALGISLGKANYCLQALMQKGLIKAGNFHHSKNKRMYMYVLTPRGIEERAKATVRFLRRKMEENKAIVAEIEQLRGEIAAMVQSPSQEAKRVL